MPATTQRLRLVANKDKPLCGLHETTDRVIRTTVSNKVPAAVTYLGRRNFLHWYIEVRSSSFGRIF